MSTTLVQRIGLLGVQAAFARAKPCRLLEGVGRIGEPSQAMEGVAEQLQRLNVFGMRREDLERQVDTARDVAAAACDHGQEVQRDTVTRRCLQDRPRHGFRLIELAIFEVLDGGGNRMAWRHGELLGKETTVDTRERCWFWRLQF